MSIKTSNDKLAIEFIAWAISTGHNPWSEDFYDNFRYDFLATVYETDYSNKAFSYSRADKVRDIVFIKYDKDSFIERIVTNGFSKQWANVFKSMNAHIWM